MQSHQQVQLIYFLILFYFRVTYDPYHIDLLFISSNVFNKPFQSSTNNVPTLADNRDLKATRLTKQITISLTLLSSFIHVHYVVYFPKWKNLSCSQCGCHSLCHTIDKVPSFGTLSSSSSSASFHFILFVLHWLQYMYE